jgi:uncharacterized membrane protein
MVEFLLVLASAVSAAFGQIFLKYGTNYKILDRKWIFFIILSVLTSTITFIANLVLFKKEEMSRISPILTAATIIVVVILSIFLFDEEINVRKGIGVAFAVLSVILLARS